MATVKVVGASVRFPLYDAWYRSFKRRFVRVSSGRAPLIGPDYGDHIDALSDVDLELGPGDGLAVLGGNGSGKTSLLRVLAGLLKPNPGRAEISGRVAAILDIGLGFGPEATAYDTMVLHGILLRMDLNDIRRRIQEVSAFCDFASELDQPLRNLSPGHVFRLGTGIAFFFGAEIILYDEVFETVGPAFVQKTKHHINHSFPGDGIIVVVERSRAILEGLCNKALVIESGRILEMDDFDAVMARHGHRYTL